MSSPTPPQQHELQQLINVKANEIATELVREKGIAQVLPQAAQSSGQQNQQAQMQALIDAQAQVAGFQPGAGQVIPAIPGQDQAASVQQSQAMAFQQMQQQTAPEVGA